MEFHSKQLLSELTKIVSSHLTYAESLQMKSDNTLNWRVNSNTWSVLECLEHLNMYGNFYVHEIRNRINNSKAPKSNTFKSGYWGNRFAMDMLPKEGMKTMKTFKSKNPIHSTLDKDIVIQSFIKIQYHLLELLKQVEEKDLTKTKTSITLPLLKFRLGDTFRFVIYHNERHIIQAKKCLLLQNDK